ncbi:DUF2268 domain-containing putative Zn-dependent protease [Paracoccus spongiarum]|uniref:DUF2268 domain-containing putative Zn-dependent protease n=1 Tax=Paracoccus spongiarum TaxID=3064387 RepID=A0ABT9JA70_9RHOB|nr:DUF2268 domain-containing putative Zn-dependent protease [Paracoccus sp. 2205BS29-5]MDP5306718.1 DUF2268 domain-containing putative Zn-dependent protease [Paracoccus sp. 2205BS29-5]
MTVWTLHLLNARHGLTRVLPDIRATARETVALVSGHADLPPFDLVVRAQPPGAGDRDLPGGPPQPGLIEIALNPDRFDPAQMQRQLIRAMHHLIRAEGPGYGRSLGEALVSEGLAGHFVALLSGGTVDPRATTAPPSGLARRAMNEWSRLDHDHAHWFLGKGDLRRWAGFGLAQRLVAEHLRGQPGGDAEPLAMLPADAFRAALRRLVAAEAAPGPDPERADREPAEDGPEDGPEDAGTDDGAAAAPPAPDDASSPPAGS